MSGVAIVRQLLAGWAPLTALVPSLRIHAGQVPQGETMPAIGISEVYVDEQETVARLGQRKTSKTRVQVTVLSKSYAEGKNIIKAAALGPGVHTGAVLSYDVKSVLPRGIGPDIPPGDDGICEQSRDFMVTFSEPN